MPVYTHKLIAQTAKEIAHAAYENMASDNNFYKLHPNARNYVRRFWGAFVGDAREILAGMLARDDVHQSQKDIIHDALMEERTLPRNRQEAAEMKRLG